MTDLAMAGRCLSIQQPWAWLIVNGFKDIENRDWRTRRRGHVLIHAGKKADRHALQELNAGRHPVTGEPLGPVLAAAWARDGLNLPTGGIVGRTVITDCLESHPSPWFVGRYGFELTDSAPLPFMPLRGQLGFFWAGYRGTAA